MLVPTMYDLAEVMAESSYSEEQVFDCGISGDIVFLVVVPLVGACRIPIEALSYFMAGADDYTAAGMPEHWSGAPSGEWTIKRERLRILADSWEQFSDKCHKLADALDRQQTEITQPQAAPVPTAGASDGVEPAKAGPLPLTTGDIAFCFAGLRWGTEEEWKKPLGDKPKWLAACIVIPGVRGASERRWNPVFIGAALVRAGHAKPNSVRAKFQTQSLLTPWLDEWKTYEADNFDSN